MCPPIRGIEAASPRQVSAAFGRFACPKLGRPAVQAWRPTVDERDIDHVASRGGPLRESHEIQVLVVDDDLALCELLRTTFELEGIKVLEAHHVIEAERLLADSRPDAIILDIGLPGVDGAFYCERLRESPQTRAIPIIAISGSQEAGVRALTAGANAFAGKPFDPISLLSTLERLVGVSPLEHALQGDQSPDGAGELRRLIQIGQRQHDLLQHSYRQTLEALVDALETRDFGTSAHSRRVSAYATRLTLEVRPSLVDDPTLEWGFLLHDVGKIGIPDGILLKPGPLDAAEADRSDRELLVPGNTQLAHREHVEGRSQASRHLEGDGNTAPRQGDDDHVVATRVLLELSRQQLPRVGTVAEAHVADANRYRCR